MAEYEMCERNGNKRRRNRASAHPLAAKNVASEGKRARERTVYITIIIKHENCTFTENAHRKMEELWRRCVGERVCVRVRHHKDIVLSMYAYCKDLMSSIFERPLCEWMRTVQCTANNAIHFSHTAKDARLFLFATNE